METGVYRKKMFDWEAFRVRRFIPHLYDQTGLTPQGCGATALSLLSGVNPEDIRNTNFKNINHWKDSFMVKFLKDRNFKVKPLTVCDVSARSGLFISDFIKDSHVILTSQLLGKNTASWAVIHDGLWYHNYSIMSLTTMDLINCPILTSYVIFHKKWLPSNLSSNKK